MLSGVQGFDPQPNENTRDEPLDCAYREAKETAKPFQELGVAWSKVTMGQGKMLQLVANGAAQLMLILENHVFCFVLNVFEPLR